MSKLTLSPPKNLVEDPKFQNLATWLNTLYARVGDGPFMVRSVPKAKLTGTYAANRWCDSTFSAIIFVPDDVGGSVLAFSDGTNWRRVTDRAIIA